MTLLYLAWRGVRARAFRSLLIGLLVLILTGFLLLTTVILWGVEESLRTGMERLGADLIVIANDPTEEAQTEVLMGKLVTRESLPLESVERIREMNAVKQASPQLYLGMVNGSAWSKAGELYVVAFDPETDFLILPWLTKRLISLGLNDVLGGAAVDRIVAGMPLSIHGRELHFAGRLQATGLWLDRALFVTYETARRMIAGGAFPGLTWEAATSIAVNIKPGYDAARTALEITLGVPGAYAVRSPRLLRTLAAQRAWLTQILFSVLGMIWIVAVALTAFIFSMIVDERRREMGLLRAAGASRKFIFRLILTECSFPAMAGGFAGILIGGGFLFISRTWLTSALGIQLLFPSGSALVFFMTGSFILSLTLVLPALLYPALRASRMDPAAAMRQA